MFTIAPQRHTAMQNGPFQLTKRAVLKCRTGRLARRNGPCGKRLEPKALRGQADIAKYFYILTAATPTTRTVKYI